MPLPTPHSAVPRTDCLQLPSSHAAVPAPDSSSSSHSSAASLGAGAATRGLPQSHVQHIGDGLGDQPPSALLTAIAADHTQLQYTPTHEQQKPTALKGLPPVTGSSSRGPNVRPMGQGSSTLPGAPSLTADVEHIDMLHGLGSRMYARISAQAKD
jgi:hypothetical protein